MKSFRFILSNAIFFGFGILFVTAENPVRVDVKVGPVAERIDAQLTRRAKEVLNGARSRSRFFTL